MTGKLIALGGYKRAGKDESGDYLEERYGFEKLGMSDALNDALQNIGPKGPWVQLDFDVFDLAPWTHDLRRGKYTKGEYVRYRDLLYAVGYTEAKLHKDVREYLQGLGTEVGREMIDQEVWVNIAEKRIASLLESGKDVVITAIRFPNELDMVARLGGTAVWIDRSAELRGADTDAHASENSLSASDFNGSLDNNGTVDQLRKNLDTLLRKVEDGTLKYPQPIGTRIDVDGRYVWPSY